ncbi:MAG: ABC transporter ATP-binding protein [Pseudomonadota bacterium]
MPDVLTKIMELLDARERRNFWLLMAGVLVMGLANMAGVGSIIPFLAVLADPDVVERNAALSRLYALSGAATPERFLIWLGLAAVAAYMAALALKALVTYANMRFALRRQHTLAMRLLERYLRQPYPWFLGRHSAELAKNVLNETAVAVSGTLMPLLNLITNGVIVLCLLALLIAVEPLIALALALLLGTSYAAIYLSVRQLQARLGHARFEAMAERFRIVQEGLGGLKEVKVLGLERDLIARASEPSRRMADISARSALVTDLPRHALEGVAFGGMMCVVLALAVLRGGDLSAILTVAGVYALAGSRMAPAAQQIYQNLSALKFGRAGLEAVHRDYTEAPAAPLPAPAAPLRLREGLALEGVRYAYPASERGALDGLDLRAAARGSIGLVGGTGAGKTTAVDVLMGLLAPQAGRLVVDGRPIETEEERRAWRRSVGYVPQQIFLADASVTRNIAFGVKDDEVDLAAVERAARMAQLHDFVMEELPDGYATHVGDRGVRLSGGQRQRIGIARALYHDPDVLVLDEATSALDNVTERAVMEAVRALGGRKTVIMIAHRLTTVMNCDEIFLLERGRVAASGAYDQLLERSPAFRAMAQGAAA